MLAWSLYRSRTSCIVNSSRAILYASGGADFAQAARQQAMCTRDLLELARQQA